MHKTEEYARTFFKLYIKDQSSANNNQYSEQSQQGSQSQQENKPQQGSQSQYGSQSQQDGQSQQDNSTQQNSQNISSAKPKDGDKNGSAFIFADPDKIKEAITALAEETGVQEFLDILTA